MRVELSSRPLARSFYQPASPARPALVVPGAFAGSLLQLTFVFEVGFAAFFEPALAIGALGPTALQPAPIQVGRSGFFFDALAGDETDHGYQVPPSVLGSPIGTFNNRVPVREQRQSLRGPARQLCDAIHDGDL